MAWSCSCEGTQTREELGRTRTHVRADTGQVDNRSDAHGMELSRRTDAAVLQESGAHDRAGRHDDLAHCMHDRARPAPVSGAILDAGRARGIRASVRCPYDLGGLVPGEHSQPEMHRTGVRAGGEEGVEVRVGRGRAHGVVADRMDGHRDLRRLCESQAG
jgi:hypothetical protein